MESEIQQIKDLFYADRLQDAYHLLRNLEASHSNDESFLSSVNSVEEIRVLREDLQEADRCLELLGDLDSWTPVKETENIAIFSKKSDSDFIVRAEMLLDQSIFPILSVCNEIDLLPEWIQVVKSVQLIKTVSPFRKVLWYKFNIPWPASNRDMVINAYGIPIPDNKSIMLVLRGVETETFLGNAVPQPDRGDVRVTMKTGVINFMKLSETQTQLSFLSHADPHVSLVPESLMNFCTQTGIYMFIKSMEDKAKAFNGSIFEERVNKNPQFYESISEVLRRTFD